MKTLLIMMLILLALAGIMSVLIYASSPKSNAGAAVEKTSLLPRDDIKAEGPAQFTPITRGEFDRLALIEDSSLMGLTAGAFNPEFAPLSDSERDTLNNSARQNLELQSMTAGNLNDNAGFGWSVLFLLVTGFFLGVVF
jgi:hypothetical protein